MLPAVTADDVQYAALSFREGTCVTDGLHPRMVGLFSEPSRAVLGELFAIFEAVGCFPKQLQDLLIHQPRKPSGGSGAIGWCRSIFRVWGKIRRVVVKRWCRGSAWSVRFQQCRKPSPRR